MKVVIAPDSFKDAIRADVAALLIANGLHSVIDVLDVDHCPIADGDNSIVL